jgi:hypothetical protein
MRRFLVVAAAIVSIVSMAHAQKFEVGLDVGYGLGMGDSVGNNLTNDTFGMAVEWKDVYASLGNGLKAMVDFTYYLNESFGVMLMSGYSGLLVEGGYVTESDFGTFGMKNTVKTSYIPVNIGIKIRGGTMMGKIRPYVYVAPGIYFPKMEETNTLTGLLAKPDDNVTYKFSLGMGFSAGVGAVFALSDAMGIKLEVQPTYAQANITEYTETLVDQSYNATTTTYVFENDKTTLKDPEPNTIYRHGQPRRTFKSVAVKLGMCYGF